MDLFKDLFVLDLPEWLGKHRQCAQDEHRTLKSSVSGPPYVKIQGTHCKRFNEIYIHSESHDRA